ncbi:MAG: MaoC family dehydratase [Sulfobacillus sp.]|nr:MaoC family dehydratase [Sulfobacillus sp.]
MYPGQTVTESHHVTQEVVQAFAQVSHDFNPLHLDPDFAKTSRFGRPVAHGALVMSYISALLGQKLPGPGTIYLTQYTEFKAPVFVGDTVTVAVMIETIHDNGVMRLTHEARVNTQTVLTGWSLVLFPPLRNSRSSDTTR